MPSEESQQRFFVNGALVVLFFASLVSFLNLLQRVQSCNNNHLILGANCEEDHALMKSYTNHLREEMEEEEGKQLTTEQGKQVVFKFELIRHEVDVIPLRRTEQLCNLFFAI